MNSTCIDCSHRHLTYCNDQQAPLPLITHCDLWPKRRPKVLWLMGDFAKGGTSRYTANLFPQLYPEIDFHVVYFSADALDASIQLHCPLERYRSQPHIRELIDWADHVSAICLSPGVPKHMPVLEMSVGKLFVQVHGQNDWTQKLVDFSSKYTNRFVACSKAAAKLLPPTALSICPETPLDFNRLLRQQTKEAAKTRFGLSGFKVVTVACRQSLDKNLLGIAEAVAVLPPSYKLLCVGTGFAEAELHPKMQAMLGDRVVFWREWLEPYEYLDASDCFICLSPSEGLPTTIIEALVHGTPVVSTPVGIVPELVLRTPGRLSRPIVHPPEELQLACEGYSASEEAEIFQHMLQRFSHHAIKMAWLNWLSLSPI